MFLGEDVQDSACEDSYGLETVALRKRQEAQLKMLRFPLKVMSWRGLGISTRECEPMLSILRTFK